MRHHGSGDELPGGTYGYGHGCDAMLMQGDADFRPALQRVAARLWAAHGGDEAAAAALQLHSVWANLNPTKTNNILSYESGAWKLMHGARTGAPGGGGVG